MSVTAFKPKMVAITQFYNGNPTIPVHYSMVEPDKAASEVARLSAIFPGHTFQSNSFSGS